MAPGDEVLADGLFTALEREAHRDPVFLTLGRTAEDRVVEVTRSEVLVETARSRSAGWRAQPVPAWMLNLAWESLEVHGELTNNTLLKHLRVHRSSAVCALLARLPGVERMPGRAVGVRLVGTRGRTGGTTPAAGDERFS